MLSCCDAARDGVCVGVPVDMAGAASPVSVTVMLYTAVGDCCTGLAPPAAASCVTTVILFKTGGVFCGK